MTSFLLLHGAWHGGWAWKSVMDRLAQSGHTCRAPDLPSPDGAGPQVGLSDHVDYAERELLGHAPAVVVAHSYSGVVARELAWRRPRDVAHVVHVETMIPADGQSFLDLVGADTREDYLTRADWVDGRWVLPPPPDVARLGIRDPQLADAVRSRLRPQPMQTFVDPASVVDLAVAPPQTYVYATDREASPFVNLVERCRASPRWTVVGLEGGHEMMLTNPAGLAAVLEDVADRMAI